MLSGVVPVALNTFREARRNRVFYSIVFFAVALILFSVLFTEVTFLAYDRILRDVGFATMNVFGVALAIFLGIGMVNREIEKKTIYTVVSKPVSRAAFILGKFVGLQLTLVTTMALMFLGFLGVLLAYQSPIEAVLLQSWLTLLFELSVITAFAIFCSTWTSSTTLCAFLTVSFFVIGHLVRDIRFFGDKSESPVVRQLGRVLTAALPDLEKLNFKEAVTYLTPTPSAAVGLALGYGVLWIALFLAAAVFIFRERDLR